MKFSVGDRVVLVADHPDDNDTLVAGCEGTVVKDQGHENNAINVEWDIYCGGHNCSGYAVDGYGWMVIPTEIKKIPDKEMTPIDSKDLSSFLEI